MSVRTYLESSREIPIADEVDVLVIGGGTAGVPAAVASARKGMRTLLVERYGFLGGTPVASLVDRILKYKFTDAKGEGTEGFFEELVERLERLGGLNEHGFVRQTGSSLKENFWSLSVDPELMKHALDQITEDIGVHVLFHTFAVDAIAQNSTVKGVIIENKGGRQAILARRVIDCSGDADIAARAGCDFQIGRPEDGLTQAATLIFRLGNVKHPPIRKNKDGTYQRPRFDKKTIHSILGKLEKARKENRYPHSPLISTGRIAAYLTSLEKEPTSQRDTEASLCMIRILKVNGINPWDLSRAEKEGRREALEIARFFRENVPGCEKSYLLDTAVHIGIRATRRIVGEYLLSKEDVIQCRKFADGIATGSWHIDIWPPDNYTGSAVYKELPPGKWYDIPYRCLVPKKIDNLLVAGRCISADHYAQGSVRIQISCIGMGQAAGTAVALSIKKGVPPRKLNVIELKNELRKERRTKV